MQFARCAMQFHYPNRGIHAKPSPISARTTPLFTDTLKAWRRRGVLRLLWNERLLLLGLSTPNAAKASLVGLRFRCELIAHYPKDPASQIHLLQVQSGVLYIVDQRAQKSSYIFVPYRELNLKLKTHGAIFSDCSYCRFSSRSLVAADSFKKCSAYTVQVSVSDTCSLQCCTVL
ncbi:hypothetical protein M405DRAFT_414190 [Rhizopogon salebrosus TDB-379]|nr:hypothetical protein M405DRAFT_414190 [Rhizopogon salebrosus TDB-379]